MANENIRRKYLVLSFVGLLHPRLPDTAEARLRNFMEINIFSGSILGKTLSVDT